MPSPGRRSDLAGRSGPAPGLMPDGARVLPDPPDGGTPLRTTTLDDEGRLVLLGVDLLVGAHLSGTQVRAQIRTDELHLWIYSALDDPATGRPYWGLRLWEASEEVGARWAEPDDVEMIDDDLGGLDGLDETAGLDGLDETAGMPVRPSYSPISQVSPSPAGFGVVDERDGHRILWLLPGDAPRWDDRLKRPYRGPHLGQSTDVFLQIDANGLVVRPDGGIAAAELGRRFVLTLGVDRARAGVRLWTVMPDGGSPPPSTGRSARCR